MQWEGQQLQDGNKWLHHNHSLVSAWGVCSQGWWTFHGGPEDHLGTPEAPAPRSHSKCSGMLMGLRDGCWVLLWGWESWCQSIGQCRTSHPSAAYWVLMQEDTHSLQKLMGYLVLLHIQRWFPEQGNSSSSSVPWRETLRCG